MTHIKKCPPLIYVLSRINPVLTIISSLPTTHFNIIPHFTHRCPKPSLSFWCTDQYAVQPCYIPHTCYISAQFTVSPWYDCRNKV